jgi:Tfp pilus assembly protein PilX
VKPIAMRSQRGLTMFFAMIMLLLLTLFAVSATQLLGGNLRITSNMASQKAAEGAAQEGLERMISNLGNFITPPTATTSLSIQNGSSEKFTVAVQGPKCIAELPAPGYSLTYALAPKRTQWDMQANTKDPTLGGAAEVHQGVSILMPAGSCR